MDRSSTPTISACERRRMLHCHASLIWTPLREARLNEPCGMRLATRCEQPSSWASRGCSCTADFVSSGSSRREAENRGPCMDAVVANYVVERTGGDTMATDTAKSPTAAPSPNARPGLTLEAGDVQPRVEASDVQAIVLRPRPKPYRGEYVGLRIDDAA